jgi:hypothetical protein
MNTLSITVDTYLSAWNETDTGSREKLIEAVWANDGRLIDPPLSASGHCEISDMAAALQAQFPGHQFRRASDVDEHHGHFRFAWQLIAPDGSVAISGMDVGAIDENGHIAQITGFFGDLPLSDVA